MRILHYIFLSVFLLLAQASNAIQVYVDCNPATEPDCMSCVIWNCDGWQAIAPTSIPIPGCNPSNELAFCRAKEVGLGLITEELPSTIDYVNP